MTVAAAKPKTERVEMPRQPPAPQQEPLAVSAQEQLLIKVHISSADDSVLLAQCSSSNLAALQEELVAKIKHHLRDDIYARVDFYKGSLIVLVSIAAAALLIVNKDKLRLVKNDIENIVRRTLDAVAGIKVSVNWKKVKRTVGVLADLISIASKVLIIFTGSSLPPFPSDNDGGWTPA